MSGWPILSVVTFLPLVGAAFILAIRGDDEVALRNMRWAALWTTIVTFVLSLLIWVYFDPASADFQFVEKHRAGSATSPPITWASTASRCCSSS